MVKIYTFTVCPYCIQAKNLLNSLGVAYEEINISNDPDGSKMAELTKKSGMRTVPQIFVGDVCLGGYSDIAALHAKGELIEKLQEA